MGNIACCSADSVSDKNVNMANIGLNKMNFKFVLLLGQKPDLKEFIHDKNRANFEKCWENHWFGGSVLLPVGIQFTQRDRKNYLKNTLINGPISLC